jgi:hypothetical protein
MASLLKKLCLLDPMKECPPVGRGDHVESCCERSTYVSYSLLDLSLNGSLRFRRQLKNGSLLIFTQACQDVGMVYGPIGAFLAEYFPARIRYTSVSVPYHIGNGWGGGLVPFITTAAYAATGSLAYTLIYPIAVPAVCFVLSLFLMPETRQNSIWAEPAAAKAVKA